MELWRYYDITHRDHTIMNPTSDEKLDEMIAMLRLPPGHGYWILVAARENPDTHR